MGIRPRVTVLGSLNVDISVTVPRLPGPGGTVLGSAARFTPGGKGANGAVAAARLGADVRMVGCVGDDDFGRRLLAALAAEGVDADGVRVVAGVPTGLAMISVDGAGENLITVAPGANHEVGAEDVARAFARPSDAVVISAEIPVPAIRSALAHAARPDASPPAPTSRRPAAPAASPPAPGLAPAPPAVCVLNLAPVPPEPIVADLDWLVVNESEAAAILGRAVDGLADATQAAADLVAVGARHAVVTVGAHGAALAAPSGAALAAPPGAALAAPPGAATLTIPGFPVTAVDTVGAGDTFVGALAVALAAGVSPAEAVRAAAAAGAAAVTRPGAQTAMPRPADILTLTGLNWPVS